MDYDTFRKVHPATRCFQRYTSDQRASTAASFRLGRRQRAAIGEFFYTHPMKPNVGFATAKDATTAAFAIYQTNARRLDADRIMADARPGIPIDQAIGAQHDADSAPCDAIHGTSTTPEVVT